MLATVLRFLLVMGIVTCVVCVGESFVASLRRKKK
jgi:hypothetical protein